MINCRIPLVVMLCDFWFLLVWDLMWHVLWKLCGFEKLFIFGFE